VQHDLNTRRGVKDHAKDAKQASTIDAEVITSLMSHPNGRAYVFRRLESAHVFHTSFDPNALTMSFREGERNQGLSLLSDIMLHCPDKFTLMLQERNTDDARRTSIAERSSSPSAGRNDNRTSAADEADDPGSDDDIYADPGTSEGNGASQG
jgi:hypothetical protein